MPTSQFIRSLVAADVLDVPTVLIARTDAHSAALLTSDVDEVDRVFCTGERTPEGFFRVKEGVKVSDVSTAAIPSARIPHRAEHQEPVCYDLASAFPGFKSALNAA